VRIVGLGLLPDRREGLEAAERRHEAVEAGGRGLPCTK
jgi:hypothetical protein